MNHPRFAGWIITRNVKYFIINIKCKISIIKNITIYFNKVTKLEIYTMIKNVKYMFFCQTSDPVHHWIPFCGCDISITTCTLLWLYRCLWNTEISKRKKKKGISPSEIKTFISLRDITEQMSLQWQISLSVQQWKTGSFLKCLISSKKHVKSM